MDSFFDYIILIFFIISMLSSLLKRRKKPPVEPSTGGDFSFENENIDESRHLDSSQSKDYKALEYNIETSKNYSDTNKSPFTDKISEQINTHQSYGGRDNFPELKSMESEYYNKRAQDLRIKLQNPESFRDYYIVSELLNKPLGLREDG